MVSVASHERIVATLVEALLIEKRWGYRDDVTDFILRQQRRMPDYLRLPMRVLTKAFHLTAFLRFGKTFAQLPLEQRVAAICLARSSRVRPLQDMIRFYESLTIFGFYGL